MSEYEYYKRLAWAYMGSVYDATALILVQVDYHYEYVQEPDGSYNVHEYIESYDINMEFPSNDIEMMVVTNQHIVNTTHSGSTDGLWDDLMNILIPRYDVYGFTGDGNYTTQLVYQTVGNTWQLDENTGVLYFTGDILLDNIALKEDEEGSGIITTSYDKLLKILLLYNNLYLYAESNTLKLGRKSFEGDGIDIDDADVLDANVSIMRTSEFDIDEIYDNIAEESYYSFIEEFYTNLANQLIKKIECEVINNQELNILDRIKIQNVSYTIAEIELDVDEFSYKIKAWSI